MTERKLLLILAAVYFTYMLDFMVMPALTQIFARVFAMNPQQLGVLVAAYTFSAAVFGVVGSTMLDRFGRKPALLWLYGGFAVAMLLCALAPSYPFLMAARIVAGAFGGLVVSMTFSIVGDTVPAERQGAAFGLVMSTFSLSSVVGVPLGLWMAGLFGWQSIFYFISAACVVILFVVATLPAMNAHIAAARDRTFAMRLQAIFGRRSNLSAFLSTALVAVASYTIVPFLNPYFVANVGFT
ncbi:MAG: MFS transporter, partial [Rhizobacter sp.]|nr:MFS transporter [Chlorobiales bacterium]